MIGQKSLMTAGPEAADSGAFREKYGNPQIH
jgi:hypothetical protein